MLRQFTQKVGNFPEATVRDYPINTWNMLAKSADKKLADFTKALDGKSESKDTKK